MKSGTGVGLAPGFEAVVDLQHFSDGLHVAHPLVLIRLDDSC